MSFELFDPKARPKAPPRPAGVPTVTVSDNKLLLVNRTATEALGEPRRVLLYFDKENRRAGIRGTEEEGLPSYSATPRSNGKQVSVGAQLFVREHKIADGRYPATMEGGMLVFGVGPERT